jgi:hypothetical protein
VRAENGRPVLIAVIASLTTSIHRILSNRDDRSIIRDSWALIVLACGP